jgi:hypothetical protein
LKNLELSYETAVIILGAYEQGIKFHNQVQNCIPMYECKGVEGRKIRPIWSPCPCARVQNRLGETDLNKIKTE